jgi:SAM-dependent methyltransferase
MNSPFAAQHYRCPLCWSELDYIVLPGLKCRPCSKVYPIIENIPVITSSPTVLLKWHAQMLCRLRTGAENRRHRLARAPVTACSSGWRDRAQSILRGMESNLSLIESLMAPLDIHYRDADSVQPDPVDWILCQATGWGLDQMLPYFHQDWADTPALAFVKSLVTDSLCRYGAERDSVAVLGAGACGLLGAIGPSFERAYGTDLSISTLLLAQMLLQGDSVEISTANTGWSPVCLKGTESDSSNIALAAADAAALPFQGGSLAVVVTQYLMDIVKYPLRVAREIRRVLKPSGIWINFSRPFRAVGNLPELPPLELSEIAEVFDALGIEIVEGGNRRFDLFNSTASAALGHSGQIVHFWVARRKTPEAGTSQLCTTAFSNTQTRDWWGQAPALADGVEIQTVQRRIFTSSACEERHEIGIASLNNTVPESVKAFTEAFIVQINGRSTLSEIWHNLNSRWQNISQRRFAELIYYLTTQHEILDLQPRGPANDL